MSDTYRIIYRTTATIEVTVEADSKEEARRLAEGEEALFADTFVDYEGAKLDDVIKEESK